MVRMGLNIWLLVLAALPALSLAAQSQSCPANINFSSGTLNNWRAYTGNNKNGNTPDAIKLIYSPGQPAPFGTTGASFFPEYDLPGVGGINIITSQGTDPFGGFQTIPTINGYAYHYSVLLGSTSVAKRQTNDQSNGSNGAPPADPPGGYVRGITYYIDVPAGPSTQPYTITYAYAMVLENGTHTSVNQPMARAIVSTPNGVIRCASPEYFLPTNGGLDSAAAEANGFTVSELPSPNESRNPANAGVHLQDVWTKGWTEVTFDLSPYRGMEVTLTFEADNCVPGGHFAYAYFALRDVCDGLRISGDTVACANAAGHYSIPSLDSALYDWSIPAGWTLHSATNGNDIDVTIGPQSGWVVARAKNSCTSLTDSLFVKLYPGALPKVVVARPDTTVCYGESAPIRALVATGTEYTWISQGSFSGQSSGGIASVPSLVNITTNPKQTTEYILNIKNDGCPVAVTDTFTVTIVQPIHIDLVSDTLVVVNQPLHFHASSSDPYRDDYEWTPSTGLSNPAIADPIGQYGPEMNSISYLVKATDIYGCYGTATVKVTIAHALPDVYVPNAFTPEKGSNNVFRPICMGVSSLDYFRVYNRWGQLMYGTSQMGQGWDGRVGGRMQESNAYLWVVKGTDYTGRAILKKGTVMLIR